MRHGLFTLLALGLPAFFQPVLQAADPVFGGQLTGSFAPGDPATDGSAVNFSAAGGFSTNSQPFLLGQVSFLAGGDSKSFVFTAGLELTGADGAAYMAFFSTPVPVADVSAGTHFAEGLVLSGHPSDTAVFGGKTYRLELDGVTQGGTFVNPQNMLVSSGGDTQATGNLWGKVIEQDTSHMGRHHCHETPEPATWLLAVAAMLGVVVWQWRRHAGLPGMTNVP